MGSGRQRQEFDHGLASGFDPGALPRSVSLGEAVAERLRRCILTAELPPHAPVPELSVCEAFGVGRAHVREALRRLDAEGLVRRVPQSGTYVAPISARLVEQGGFLRLSAEEANVAGLAGAREPAVVARLEALLEQQAGAIESDDKARFHALDEGFHATLFSATDRAQVWDWLQPAKLHVDRARFATLGIGSAPRRAHAEHVRIVAAVAEGDPEAAARAMRVHLQRIDMLIDELDRLEPSWVDGRSAAAGAMAAGR